MNDGPPKLPQPYYPQWSHSNEFAAYTADQMRAYAAQAVAAERERWQRLRDNLQADIDRPEGRWGMHGRSGVEDDYFAALDYVVERMDEILWPNAGVQRV